MANNKSAKKRILINKRNNLQNRFYKSSIKTSIKIFLKKLETYKISQNLSDKQELETQLNLIYSLIDKASKKNILHRNTAARKKSKLKIKLQKI